MSADPLLDAILAAPDDDAPRLVWADREGGERGELVVIQCAIAAGRATDELLRRATELLATNGRRWRPPELAALRSSILVYVRGFIEDVFSRDPEMLASEIDLIPAHCPTLRAIELVGFTDGIPDPDTGPSAESVWGAAAKTLATLFERLPEERITKLSVDTSVSLRFGQERRWFGDELLAQVVETPSLAGLRALGFDGLTREAYPLLARLPRLASFDTRTIVTQEDRFDAAHASELLRAAPNIRRLRVRLHGEELARFVASPECAQLERLTLEEAQIGARERAIIAGLPPARRARIELRWGR